jgi:hypothetical protein
MEEGAFNESNEDRSGPCFRLTAFRGGVFCAVCGTEEPTTQDRNLLGFMATPISLLLKGEAET